MNASVKAGALVALLLPAVTLAQGIQRGPRPAFDTAAPALAQGVRPSLALCLPFDVPGCYASGAAMGTKGETVTVVRASAKSCQWNGALHSCNTGELCASDAPGGAVGEPAATNLSTWSEAFDDASWLKAAGTLAVPVVTPNQATAPDGALTADRIDFPALTAPSQYSVVYRGANLSVNPYTHSIWVRSMSGTGTVYLTVNITTTWYTTACAITTTWSRCSVATPNLSAVTWYWSIGPDSRTNSAQPASQPALSLYAWGDQLEQKAFATSYVPTAGAAASRSADAPSTAAEIPAANGGAWCRGATWTPVGTWAGIGTLWSAGSSANSASLGASGSNLVFTVTDGASGTKTVTYALSSIATGARRIFACTNGGTLGLYVDGLAAGSAAGAGTGVISSAPTLALGTNAAASLKDWRSCKRGTLAGDCR